MKKDDILEDVYNFLATSNPYDTECVCGQPLNSIGCGTCVRPQNCFEASKRHYMDTIGKYLGIQEISNV